MFPQIKQSKRIISFDLTDQYSATLLGDIVSGGVIQYHFVLTVTNNLGGPLLHIASEWSAWYPERKLMPVLGIFLKGDHMNIRDDPALIDEHVFVLKAIETAREYLSLPYAEPCAGELWGITGVMNKIGDWRTNLEVPAPLLEVKYFLPFFSFSEEIKEYLAIQERSFEVDRLRAMVAYCMERFTTVAKGEAGMDRPILRLVQDVRIVGATFAAVEVSEGALTEVESNKQLEPWLKDSDLWIGRHRSLGLIVVTDHVGTFQASLHIYILDQDRTADFITNVLCDGIAGNEISEYEVEQALLGYGTYLRMCWPFSASQRFPSDTLAYDDFDNEPAERTPSGLDPPEGWNSSDGWNQYGDLSRSDNY